jgi:hypothetical protein
MENGIFQYPAIERKGVRAIAGDTMWVLLNPIKADKRETFEHFVRDILQPAVEKTYPEMVDKTRFLHPTQPNADGTYTYIFLLDPAIPDADYHVASFLKQVYPDDKVQEYLRMWSDSFAADQVSFVVKQSTW